MTYKNIIKNKNIILGVTGSIAAYKSIFLASLLVKEGANVQVIMSESSKEFVGKSSFSGITHNSVITGYYDEKTNLNIDHIELAKKADIIVIAPATANTISKLALGISDNPIIGSVLATSAPILIAPAMDGDMYKSKQVTENIKKLLDDKTFFIGPDKGRLASGINEKGRMSEPEEIFDKIKYIFSKNNDYKNVKSIVTAGGTREAIDPVRFITNKSSGKMGIAIAEALRDRGSNVTMIHSNLYKNHKIEGIDYVKIQTAEEMKTEIFNKIEDSDLIVMAAAVGDFRVKTINRNKLKKDQLNNLFLEKNPDILKSINKSNIVKVGFAAESENLLENAKEKFTSKDCNIIVANDITEKNSGFGSDQNKAIIIEKNNVEKLPLMEKTTLAHIILDKAKNYLS